MRQKTFVIFCLRGWCLLNILLVDGNLQDQDFPQESSIGEEEEGDEERRGSAWQAEAQVDFE